MKAIVFILWLAAGACVQAINERFEVHPMRQLLNVINEFRAQHDVSALTWNKTLTHKETQHSSVFKVDDTHVPTIDLVVIAVNSWYNEGHQGNQGCRTDYDRMVSDVPKQIGCGLNNTGNDYVVLFCNYDPPVVIPANCFE